MSAASGEEIIARLDRLPMTAYIWKLVVLLSLGGFFELYDLFYTGYVVPGIVKSGLLTDAKVGIFSGAATFVAATFGGLWAGTLLLSFVSDRFGRRPVFTLSLLWYSIGSAVLAFQSSAEGILIWRFVASIGIGVELVTISTYISELVPKDFRGRAFAANWTIQYAVIPVVAFLSYLLVPITWEGWDGWRLVVLLGSLGALVVWFIRLALPESPRWLVERGRLIEANHVTSHFESRVIADLGSKSLPPLQMQSGPPLVQKVEKTLIYEIWAPAYRSRTIMLIVFQFFQTVAFYGFASWVPTLIAQQGVSLINSLLYSSIIACANPFGPALASFVADRFERKWLLVFAAAGTGIFGLCFAESRSSALIVLFGVLVTLCNTVLGFSTHAYGSELFPTRIRATAFGFTYSFSRLSSIFMGFIVGLLLQKGGVTAVFGFIAFAMLMVIGSIAIFGPRTRNLRLEEISR